MHPIAEMVSLLEGRFLIKVAAILIGIGAVIGGLIAWALL